MIAAHIDKGDVVSFSTGEEYLVTKVVTKHDRVGKIDTTVVHLERPNGSELQFHVPAKKNFGIDGVNILEGNGHRCESCSAFLHEENPGSYNDAVGAHFCSAGEGCNR